MILCRRLISTALAVGAIAACSKAPENAAATPPPATVTTAAAEQPAGAAQPAPSVAPPSDHPAAAVTRATAAPEPAAPPSASAHAESTAKPKAAAKPASAGAAAHGAAPVAAAEGPKKFDCGEKGQPTCPLQGFMKSQMATAVASGDGTLLAKALDNVAAHAPPGLANWSAIAKGGAGKARSGDIDGAKASCKACHDQYKTRYKTEMRDRAW